MSEAITATFVKDLSEGWSGTAKLYRLSSPVTYAEYEEDGDGNWASVEKTTEHVVASAVVAMFSGPEVLIFPTNEDGEVLSWGEIGGYRGGLNHEDAIRRNEWRIA